jgi:8-oxo-dGTP pyrophosphatase MutT (NUDIX family)
VRVEQGRGAYVQERPVVRRVRRIPHSSSGSSFAAEMRRIGLDPKTDLVEMRVVTASPEIAERLRLGSDESVLMRQRHMYASGRPVQLATSYIPLAVAGDPQKFDPDANPTVIYERLAELGNTASHISEEIEVRRPTPDEARFLELADGQPVLVVTRLTLKPAPGAHGRRHQRHGRLRVAPALRVGRDHRHRSWRCNAGRRGPLVKRHSVSASAVVIRRDARILAVQRRDTGAWVIPGGVVEPGEAITHATAREVFEETGVRIALGSLSGIYQNLSTDVVSFVFRAAPDDTSQPAPAPDQNDRTETARIRWLTPDDVDRLMTAPFISRVRDALARQPAPYLRTIREPHLMAPR